MAKSKGANMKNTNGTTAFVLGCLGLAIAALSASVFAAPVPVAGDAPVPVERLRPGNPAVFPMTGTWRFKLEHGVSPAVKGELPADSAVPDFAAPEAADADWKNIPVPANWEIEGFSIPTYQERTGTLSDDIGLYRRWVDVPASFAGQRVLWHFDGAYNGAEVFVNGQRCGYHESGFTAFDIDVTKALKPGQRNLMAVRLYKRTSSASLDHGDFWCLGGIYRETYLVALPALYMDDVTVVTDLDAQYKDATLKSTARVAGPAGAHFVLTGELYSLDGAKVALPAMSQAGDLGADGFATVVLVAPVIAPRLWSAEKPNLYYVFYRLSDSSQAVVERVQERIGFRKVELKGGVFMVNGVPVKFAGTCRHEEFSPYGHALTEECWQTDIALMKACNINAIRTSHYNHAARFMELCDEAGFYVLDEVPSCWVVNEIRDASRTWAYIFRSKETLARDKNRPCVVVWSCGNESGYGINNQAEFDYMKANDPTRLALISQQNLDHNPKTDFEDYHLYPFPSPQELRTMSASTNRAKVPIILTEYGSGGATGLASTWNVIWSTDAIVGATIWEWQAQGMYDKFPERWSVPSPGARNDPKTGYRTSGGNGPVTADRQLTPLYWNLKMAHSPVNTTAREVAPVAGQCVVPIQNRYSFTDLAELTCRWQALGGEKVLSSGESHIAAKPRSSVEASFPAMTGMDTLRLEFIHPDGRSVYVTRLHTKDYQGPAAPAALPAAGPIRLSETEQNVVVETAGTQLVLDKRTAQITSWRAGDQDVILGGPILNLGESSPGGGRRGGGGGGGGRGRGRGPAFVSSAQAPQYRNPVITARMDGPNAKLAVAADVYLAESDEPKAQLTYTLDISPDAQADLSWSLAWKATNAAAREAGLKFLLPATTDRISWFSDSVWTEYPAGHIDSPQGSATSKDIAFSSSRRDIHWMSLSGAGNYSLVALATGQPLLMRSRIETNGIMLFLNSAIAPASREAPGDDTRLTQATRLAGGFRLRVTTTNAQSRPEITIPHLRKQGAATQLIVDGKPFLALAAELNNSSASSLSYMKPLWPRLVANRINTVLATVSWELIEPEEGQFDFKLVDGVIQEARANGLHLVFLWFGSWKNGKSTYQPSWVKADQARFPLIQNEQGKSLPTMTTLSDANRDADGRAFAALMRHLRDVDGAYHTVLMMQVENETGVLDTPRDYCPAANAAFSGPVPTELMDYLQEHKATLIPQLRQAWEANGFKTSGTWEEVFGKSAVNKEDWKAFSYFTEEIFMAWNYARYVGHVAAAGKAEYPLPMYVNAWLKQQGTGLPGMYPSGGPLSHVMDIWRAGAPAIDILSPDIYVPNFTEWCEWYTQSSNPLFIPESRGDTAGVANAIWAFGAHDAMGYSPFGIDRSAGADTELARGYAVLSQVAPLILANQGTGKMTALLLESGASAKKARLGNYNLEVRFSSRSFGPPTGSNAPPDRVAALLISTGPDDYVIAGRAMNVYFTAADSSTDSVGLAMVEEGIYEDGRWLAGRRLNGDETPEWKALRFRPDNYSIQRVKLYRYR